MHQHPRPSPRTASAANSLQTNPTRTNNQRDTTTERTSTYPDTSPYGDRGAEEGDGEIIDRTEQMSEVDQRDYQRTNQIIQVRFYYCPKKLMPSDPTKNTNTLLQQFFIKSALTIISSRVMLPQSFNRNGELRQNKWVRRYTLLIWLKHKVNLCCSST